MYHKNTRGLHRKQAASCDKTFLLLTLAGIVTSLMVSSSDVRLLINGAVGYTLRTSFKTASTLGRVIAGFLYRASMFSSTSCRNSSCECFVTCFKSVISLQPVIISRI